MASWLRGEQGELCRGPAGVRAWLGTHLPGYFPADAAFKNSFLLLPGKLWGIRTPEIGFYLFLACLWSYVQGSPQEATSATQTLLLCHVTCSKEEDTYGGWMVEVGRDGGGGLLHGWTVPSQRRAAGSAVLGGGIVHLLETA